MPEKTYESLPENTYGSKTQPGLTILRYLGPKDTKTEGTTRHTFLVGSLNGTKGTAFLQINLRESWLTPGAVALAMNDHSNVSKADLDSAEKQLYSEAAAAVIKANTPADKQETATTEQYNKNLTTARIAIGTLFRLQDWDGANKNDPNEPMDALVECFFSGHVRHREFGGSTQVEVDRVLPCRSVTREG